MTKHFCDKCGVELTESNSCSDDNKDGTRLKHQNAKGISFEVMTAKDGTWNSGEFCKYCVIDAVKILDDRPRAEVQK